jgi:hypothetical protein
MNAQIIEKEQIINPDAYDELIFEPTLLTGLQWWGQFTISL